MKYIQILFVVETNSFVKSDDLYYSWIMRNFYRDYVSNQGFEDICVKYDFVHMDGKTNYNKKRVREEINSKMQMFSDGETFVVYCLDYDKNSAQNASFVDEALLYCRSNGYYLVACYREIEDVLEIPQGKSKTERVRLFAKKPHKKDFINKRCLMVELSNIIYEYGRSNICLVIDELLDFVKRLKK